MHTKSNSKLKYIAMVIIGICLISFAIVFGDSLNAALSRLIISLGCILILRYISLLYYKTLDPVKAKRLQIDLYDERNVSINHQAKARAGEILALLLALYTLFLSTMEVPTIVYILNIVLIGIYLAVEYILIAQKRNNVS